MLHSSNGDKMKRNGSVLGINPNIRLYDTEEISMVWVGHFKKLVANYIILKRGRLLI